MRLINTNFYTYVYLDTRKPGFYSYCGLNNTRFVFDYEPFLIGKGKNNRIRDHLKETQQTTSNHLKVGVINKIIIETGCIPVIEKYKENLLEQQAFDLEVKMINIIGRRNIGKGPLTNLTNGGEGCIGCIRPSGNNHPRFGKNIPQNVKNKISKSLKGRKIPKEQIERMIKTKQEKRKNIKKPIKIKMTKEEKSKKISESLKGKKKTKEHKEKLSVSLKKRLGTPSEKKRLSIQNHSDKNPMAKLVNINGKIFKTVKSAGLFIKVQPQTVTNRIKKGVPGYSFVNSKTS